MRDLARPGRGGGEDGLEVPGLRRITLVLHRARDDAWISGRRGN